MAKRRHLQLDNDGKSLPVTPLLYRHDLMADAPTTDTQRLQEAADLTRSALDAAEVLVHEGWVRQETLPTFTLVNEAEDVAGAPFVAAIDALRPLLIAAKLTCRWGSDFLTLETVDTGLRPLVLTAHANGTLQATFNSEDLPDAEAAFNGDAAAALRLVGAWHADLNIDPARYLAMTDTSRHWLVLANAHSVETLLTSRPWWELKRLVEPGRPLVIAVHDIDTNIDIRTADQRICALSLVPSDGDISPSPARYQERRSRWQAHAVPPGIPNPSSLHPHLVSGRDPEVPAVIKALARQASACCWAFLATTVTIEGHMAHAEFFGLQRQEWPLEAIGPDLTPKEHEATYRLWEMSLDGATPDRLLATRQIVSLYQHEPWADADDVIDASEPLFLALRSTATAEALRAQREARALALSVARQTADATTGLAKNAVERALAVFAAVGGIIVARTTNTLTMSQATGLRHLLGVYLLILVAWSFFLEGRPVTSAISALKADLGAFSDLLTESEQKSILESKTVKYAQQQAWIARIVVPLAYLAAAIVALTLRG